MIAFTKLALVAALAVLLCSGAWAQEPVTAPLSLDDCVALAMKNQIDIVTAKNSVYVAEGRLTQARSSYYPQVTIQNNTFQESSRNNLQPKTTGTGVIATMNVYDGGLREASVKGALFGLKEAEAFYERTRQTVVFNVTTDYYSALKAKHLAAVSEENVKLNEALRAQVQARADVGDAAAVEVLPLDAQLANSRVDLLSAQNAVLTSLIQLQSAMGLSPQASFDIMEVTAATDAEILPLDQYLSKAAAHRPDILQSRANLGVSRASVSSARIPLYPRAVISGDYQQNLSGHMLQDDARITGSIVFDVFDGGANRAAYKIAKAGANSAEHQLLQTDKDIRSQVEQAYINLTNAKQRIAASDVGLNASQLNFQNQRERYNLGLGTTLDLLNAEVQLITSQNNSVQARYQYFTAIAQLNYAVGQ